MLSLQGESSELQCKHNVSTFYMISWYQQTFNDASMQLVAYVRYKSANVETSFSSYFNVSGDGAKHSTLYLVKLKAAEHTAVYYCAASMAQCFRSHHPATKTCHALTLNHACYIPILHKKQFYSLEPYSTELLNILINNVDWFFTIVAQTTVLAAIQTTGLYLCVHPNTVYYLFYTKQLIHTQQICLGHFF